MNTAEAASLIVAVVALLISGLSAVAVYRTQKSQTRMQERLLALEVTRERAKNRDALRAQLRAQLIGDRLLITNEGSGEARGIQVRFDSQQLSEHELWVGGQEVLTQLGSGASAKYLLSFAFGKPTAFTIELLWADDSGEPGRWTSQLKL